MVEGALRHAGRSQHLIEAGVVKALGPDQIHADPDDLVARRKALRHGSQGTTTSHGNTSLNTNIRPVV
jgi:hypothetical protein